ncbi:MAG: HlyD family type I secretion periplasmic adaptor subunit [Thiobacillaceae bacterium]|jgi:HlyD family type I secretion membrane fusion protein|nr:HlyD family type I secretion periplasmic adaptor subunit [Thiobacillaceae bacterium]
MAEGASSSRNQPAAGRIARWGYLVLALTAASFALWGALAPVSGAVIAPGVIKVDNERKRVQHLEGGIVSEIHVRDGDTVRAGQVLVAMADEGVGATVDLLRGQLFAERVVAARLEAERNEWPQLRLEADLRVSNLPPSYRAVLDGELHLFEVRRETFRQQTDLLRAQIQEIEREMVSVREQLAAETRAVAALQEQLAANERLVEQQFIQKTRLLELKATLGVREAERAEHLGSLSRGQQRIGDLNLRLVQLRADLVQQAAAELEGVKRKIMDLRERLRPSQDAQHRQAVLAPVSGRVVNLAVHTPGGVVRAGELLMEIVPDRQELIVEVRIRPQDIDEVAPGNLADVQLSAYNSRTAPMLEGEVRYISADRLVDEASGLPYYAAQLLVKPSPDPAIRLYPGMPAEAFIRTRARSPLEYLLEPVTNVLRRSMRET